MMNREVIYKDETYSDVGFNKFIYSVYSWMTLGLLITGLLAMVVSSSQAIISLIYGNRIMPFVFAIALFGLVMYLSANIQRLDFSTSAFLFLLYSALNGVFLSSIFIVYARSLIFMAFFICALTFAITSFYGYATKSNLSKMGGFLTMSLIGIIIASLVNMFVRSSSFAMMLNYLIVIVFVLLTAYNVQMLKKFYFSSNANEDMLKKVSLMGALQLYLNFINLFLAILRIMGSRRD